MTGIEPCAGRHADDAGDDVARLRRLQIPSARLALRRKQRLTRLLAPRAARMH
jgi:hypothetical protein